MTPANGAGAVAGSRIRRDDGSGRRDHILSELLRLDDLELGAEPQRKLLAFFGGIEPHRHANTLAFRDLL